MSYIIELIEKILKKRITMSLTIHFDGLGGYKIESKLGDNATHELFKLINKSLE